jgi:hypothetical protein
MEYSELETRHKHHLNGRLSQFMDAFIRQHKVWTPEQMHSALFEKIEDEISKGQFTYETRDNELTWTAEPAIRWLNTDKGRQLALERFQKKYEKDKPIADRKSPLVERVRFGLHWDKSKYFDINFGLKGGHNFIETDELKNLTIIPWTVEHVNNELDIKHDTDIVQCLNKLSTSHLEKLFIEHWTKHYYQNDNPAIIPEVCGLRGKFYYYEYGGNVYTTIQEIPGNYFEIFDDVKTVNFRYDFLVVNFKKQKIAFIELDGFEFHKTRPQQTIDSIKRNTASLANISLLTFTSKRITEDIDAVFKELDDYLTL